jgi:putative transcriptional regulator
MRREAGTKRNIFAELMEGVDAMGAHRGGKVTLRTHSLPEAEVKESPGAEFFVAAREKFNVSRAVWANMLRVSPRTVEKWEQGGQVSPLAATFVELVSRYPDTIDRLQTLPKRVSRVPNASGTRSDVNIARRPSKAKRDSKAHVQTV